MIFFILHNCMTCDCDHVTGVILLLCMISHYTFLFFLMLSIYYIELCHILSPLIWKTHPCGTLLVNS